MADQKILVMRLGSLGDIVHTFPAVAALRESFTNAEIIWVTHPKWQALVRSLPSSSSGGVSVTQMSLAYLHRGWNEHPLGGRIRFGGRPLMVASSVPLASRRGMDSSRPSEYGCAGFL